MVEKVFFDITNCCNSNCIHCFTNAHNNISDMNNEMSTEQLKKLIDDLIELEIKEISIGGGEPFLKDIVEILDYIGDRVQVSVTTNGTILNNNIIESLEKHNVKITVSLDSLNQEVSQKVRKGIDVGIVINNIKKLLKNYIIRNNLSIRTTISKYNMTNVFDIIDFCNENGIAKMKINTVNNFGRAKQINIDPLFDDFMDLLEKVINYIKEKDIKTKILLPVEKYLKNVERKCTLGLASVYIDAFGNVFPCAFSEGNLNWGNVLENGIANIFMRNKNWDYENSTCHKCPINRYKKYKVMTI